MSNATTERRLRRLEAAYTFRGDIERATDAQLYSLIRDSYRNLAAQHGSLAQAVTALRGSGDPDDAALAVIIEEDTGGPHAQHH